MPSASFASLPPACGQSTRSWRKPLHTSRSFSLRVPTPARLRGTSPREQRAVRISASPQEGFAMRSRLPRGPPSTCWPAPATPQPKTRHEESAARSRQPRPAEQQTVRRSGSERSTATSTWRDLEGSGNPRMTPQTLQQSSHRSVGGANRRPDNRRPHRPPQARKVWSGGRPSATKPNCTRLPNEHERPRMRSGIRLTACRTKPAPPPTRRRSPSMLPMLQKRLHGRRAPRSADPGEILLGVVDDLIGAEGPHRGCVASGGGCR